METIRSNIPSGWQHPKDIKRHIALYIRRSFAWYNHNRSLPAASLGNLNAPGWRSTLIFSLDLFFFFYYEHMSWVWRDKSLVNNAFSADVAKIAHRRPGASDRFPSSTYGLWYGKIPSVTYGCYWLIKNSSSSSLHAGGAVTAHDQKALPNTVVFRIEEIPALRPW